MGGPRLRDDEEGQDEDDELEQEQQRYWEADGSDGQDLFQYLQSLVTHVEAATGIVDIEMREKIDALYSETRKVPHAADSTMNGTEISNELDRLSDKLNAFEQKLSEITVDPEVHGILTETAGLWMPLITGTAEDRRKLTSTQSS
ncbi:hypothetical protein O6H91_22G036700 [Diphasiastrum complanatum]|uniref:Uncharacterized protein n=2 Tax=Diphasiastrum complanatum TaxID=34168 RepID=A0ACC2AET9_DIPCM|nr:hypothetical protein O6H91_22G035800 [Diphasiastrum complanatum]KAJ7515976.1 hypothetical protein O6H91_22G036700 [Diphasiastrum complanatum]